MKFMKSQEKADFTCYNTFTISFFYIKDFNRRRNRYKKNSQEFSLMDEKIQRAMEQIVEETLKDQPQWEDAYNKQTEKNGETETEAEPEEKRIEESRRKGS